VTQTRLKHSYHDSEITSVECREDGSLTLGVELCSCSDVPGAQVHLVFCDVRNLSEVRAALNAAMARWKNRGPRIIGIVKEGHRRHLLDLDTGEVWVDAKTVLET